MPGQQEISMSGSVRFPKDTSPYVQNRANQISRMTMEDARAHILDLKADLDARSLFAWFGRLCAGLEIPLTDPAVAAPPKNFRHSLVSAIQEYDRGFNREPVEQAIRGTIMVGGWKMPENRKKMLIALFNRLEELSPPPLPVCPAQVTSVIPVPTIRRINRMVRFAALNVDAFPNVPPRTLINQVKNRKWVTDQDTERQDACGKQMALAKIMGKMSPGRAHEVEELVLQARAAVCTTFASAVASILNRERGGRDYRVELISGPNHCFCIVNRAGEDVEEFDKGARKMPGYSRWGDGYIIVDAWAGAMGYDKVFFCGYDDYPTVLRVYLTSYLLQHFDSRAAG
jgi:hypothetical protein